MPDGSSPATPAPHAALIQILNQLERAINRDETGDALALTARAQAIALQSALTAPCPDCGSTDEGHATPCGKRAAGTTFKQLALVFAVLCALIAATAAYIWSTLNEPAAHSCASVARSANWPAGTCR